MKIHFLNPLARQFFFFTEKIHIGEFGVEKAEKLLPPGWNKSIAPIGGIARFWIY